MTKINGKGGIRRPEDAKDSPTPPPANRQDNGEPYIGCKVIRAKPMDYETFARRQGKWQEGQETMGDGYEVTYPDGYVSWSPKRVFDECYRKISQAETKLINA